MICDYGCGQEAKYQFKNGKWCCREKWQYCLSMKKQISNKLLGRPSPNKGSVLTDEKRKNISNGHLGLKPWNKDKLVLDLNRIKKRYPFFYKIENPIEKNGKVYVKCKFCKEYFIPTKNQLSERIRCLEKQRDNSEQHFYCSNACKRKCPIYHAKPIFKNKKNYPSESQLKIYREIILKRDSYKCTYCGNIGNIVHHIFPIKICPEFSLDLDYGLTVCHDCHDKYCHKNDCSYHKIAYKRTSKKQKKGESKNDNKTK